MAEPTAGTSETNLADNEDSSGTDKKPPLLWQAAKDGDLEAVRALVESGAEVGLSGTSCIPVHVYHCLSYTA